jgi:hypothetical protein
MLNNYIISGISNIYLTSNQELISIGHYGFNVNCIRSNSWSKQSSSRVIRFYDNILIIFEAPSNLYLSKLLVAGELITEGSGSVSFVVQSSDSGLSLKCLVLKIIVTNNLRKQF